MMLSGHIVASSVTSFAFYGVTKSWPATLACFLSGIFIDLDHVVDYCLIKRKWHCSFKQLKDFCLNDRQSKVYLFFHSIELLALLWAAYFYYDMDVIWLGVLVGLSVHMALDQLTNDVYPATYSFIYRLKLGFPKRIFFKSEQH